MNECDLVMRGGVTSGIVYPKAIVGLSKQYRFRSIGGASAGAIAAAFAAAAEYGRAKGGFTKLDAIPNQFGSGVARFFQPHPAYRKLFAAILKRMKEKKSPGVWFFLRNGLRLVRALKELPRTNFGICPGTTTDASGEPALVDWMNRQLEHVAGRIDNPDAGLPATPLTFGELKRDNIELRLITTNLSQRRPENLPIGAGFRFLRSDLDWLLPRNVRDWILRVPTDSSGYVDVPHGDDMPVILAVRMSLSFPVLFSTVPLYSQDFSLHNDGPCEGARDQLRVNLFSDGGLSSDFPIHYFDTPLPTRPTFGITLTDFHECREEPDRADFWNRVFMPARSGDGLTFGIDPIAGVVNFFSAMVSAAKDWQDSVQMRMPGYRERVVRIALKDDEGGLNFTMAPETIARIGALGERASERILNGHSLHPHTQPAFELQIHRWRRLLAATEAIEELLEHAATGYTDPEPSGDPGLGSIAQFLDDLIRRMPTEPELFKTLGYAPPNQPALKSLKARWDAFVAFREQWANLPLGSKWNLPSPNPSVKFRSARF